MSNKQNGKYCILALDGGGVRSIIETIILQRIIDVYPNFLDGIDLIAGASAGGILALDLATGASNVKVGEFFKSIVPEIFHKSWLHEFTSLDSAIAPSYTNEKLKDVLTKQFGNLKLKDLPKKVLIPSFQLDNHSANPTPILSNESEETNDNTNNNNNISNKIIIDDEENCQIDDNDFEFINVDCNGNDPNYSPPPPIHHRRWAPRFFHNLHHSKTNDSLVVDVALRTSAAPTYFPIYQGFVDGGVYANNPSLCAVTTAIASGIQMKDIVVLSISTGRDGKYVSPDQYGTGNWGLAQWAPTLINMLLDSNVEISDFQCSQLLGSAYHRVDPLLTKNIDLDQPKFIPLLEEIANNVDLTSTFLWIENFWNSNGLTPTSSTSNPNVNNNNNNNNSSNQGNKTPPTYPSYSSPKVILPDHLNILNSYHHKLKDPIKKLDNDDNNIDTITINGHDPTITNNNKLNYYRCSIQ